VEDDPLGGSVKDLKELRDERKRNQGKNQRVVEGRYRVDPDGYSRWWELATSGEEGGETGVEEAQAVVPEAPLPTPTVHAVPKGVRRIFIGSTKGLVETYQKASRETNIVVPLYSRRPDGHLGAVEMGG
jgi:hypothetical protein